MLADVEAFALLLFGDAQADDEVDDLVRDERDDRRPDDRDRRPPWPGSGTAPRCRDSRVVPVTQSCTEPGPPRIGRVEDAGQQRAEDAADGVHAEHVERVVGLEQSSSGR